MSVGAEIAKATDWQNHSIRKFISGQVKKLGLKVESMKSEAGLHIPDSHNRRVKYFLDFPQQQNSRIGGDVAAVEFRDHFSLI